jgi:hypothetical protein
MLMSSPEGTTREASPIGPLQGNDADNVPLPLRADSRRISPTSTSPPRRESGGPTSLSPVTGETEEERISTSPERGSTEAGKQGKPLLLPHTLVKNQSSKHGWEEFGRARVNRNDSGHMTATCHQQTMAVAGRIDPLTRGRQSLGVRHVVHSKASGVCKRDPLTRNVDTDGRRGMLMLEAKAIEEEIRSNKSKLLKSVLKKERIELLHRSLHGKPVSQDERVSKKGGVVETLQDELMQLNEEIVSEKRRLLKVVKRMEEGRAEDAN